MPTCPGSTAAGSYNSNGITSIDSSRCMDVDGGDKDTISPGTKLLWRGCAIDGKITKFDLYDDKCKLLR